MGKRKRVLGTSQSTLILYGLIGIVWTLYRALFRFSEAWDEFFFKPLVFLGPVFLWVKLKEGRDLGSLGFSRKNFLKNSLIGLFLGLLFAAEGVVTSAIKHKELVFNPSRLGIDGIVLAGFISLATGFSEEVLNRGFLMNRLWESWGSEFRANLISAFLFALFHLPMAVFVLNYLGSDILKYEFLIFVLGVADGFVFARTRTLMAPVVSHALWNWSVILFR